MLAPSVECYILQVCIYAKVIDAFQLIDTFCGIVMKKESKEGQRHTTPI